MLKDCTLKDRIEHFATLFKPGNPTKVDVLTPPMSNASLKDDPKYWRRLAEEARAAADKLGDPEARRLMIEIAQGYEELAVIAERKQASDPNTPGP
jgi:hypothetical protein